jgi:polyisoprenyl-phosphate glycosyltransferase
LSVVFVVRNQSSELEDALVDATAVIAPLVSDYELIIVDNASEDDSVAVLKKLTGEQGLPNLQVYALTKEVDSDTASWVGLENALGDFVAVIDPLLEDIKFLPTLLDEAVGAADVVFAFNDQKPGQKWIYRVCFSTFNTLYRLFNGIHLAKEAPQYRLLSRQVVNFVLQHPIPAITYRYLPATGGFAQAHLNYSGKRKAIQTNRLVNSIDRGVRLLVSGFQGL